MPDPIKIFVKDEPHKRTKIAAGRERIIFALSVVDQMVDRLLFKPMIDVEVRNPGAVVAKAGWSPLPEGYQAIVKQFPGDVMAVDKTAWDWTMPEWVVYAYFGIKMDQCVDSDDLYEGMCWLRMMQVVGSEAYIRLPDGRQLQQDSVGLMKSGWLLTLSMNSMAQALQHAVASFAIGEEPPRCWALGDDFISRAVSKPDDYVRELSRTGCLVKHAKNILEFAGFDFTNGGVTPLYWKKHQFLLNYVEPDIEQDVLLSYFMLYSLSTNRWLDSYRKYANFPVGKTFELWAKGLIKMDVTLGKMSWLEW